MTNLYSRKIFRLVASHLPESIACAMNKLNPGCLTKLSVGIKKVHPDDTFIVSYPRSGNTWTRYILAYLIAGVDKPLTSAEVSGLAPDMYNDLNQINSSTSKKLIKTHDPLLHLYPRVIYIHRDPREALVSYWHFSSRIGIFSGSFSKFLRSPIPNQHGSWTKHMKAMDRKVSNDSQNIHILRYDQLQNDFHNTVSRLVDWTGLGNHVDLEALYKLTSMETMARSDQSCESAFRFKSGESFFVDRGKGSEWRKTWTTADLDWLAKDREMMSLMEKNGYC